MIVYKKIKDGEYKPVFVLENDAANYVMRQFGGAKYLYPNAHLHVIEKFDVCTKDYSKIDPNDTVSIIHLIFSQLHWIDERGVKTLKGLVWENHKEYEHLDLKTRNKYTAIKPLVIDRFVGKYRFLSNFYEMYNPVSFMGLPFPTVEHAYVAAKCNDKEDREFVCYCMSSQSAGEVKRYGKTVNVRPDWKILKEAVMRSLVYDKFHNNPDLMERLQATKPFELIEGNNWGDTFWGECPIGTGRNELGKILMAVRDDPFLDN